MSFKRDMDLLVKNSRFLLSLKRGIFGFFYF